MRVTCQDVSIELGGRRILKSVSIDTGARRFIGVIGPNGSGKSTLLKCVYRVLKPTNGAILLDGDVLNTLPARESAKRMAVVAQHNYYNFEFSVQDVVLMGRAPHKRRMERDNAKDYEIVRESLRKVEMEDFIDRSFSTLSGGEQQRIILARALAQQTPCLILDEPTNHLDVKYQLQILDVVKNMDVSVLAALHDLNIAAMYCDELYALKDGVIWGHGTPKELLTPAFLRDVYEVDAIVAEDAQTGILHITYRPLHARQEVLA